MAALSLAVAGALAAGPPGGASPADAAPTAARLPVPETIAVPAGVFLAGSDVDERARAYALDASAYGHSRTREQGWYDGERALAEHVTGAYHVTRTPITNAQYAAFVAETGHRAPDVDARTWAGYGLVHPFERTRRHAWRGGRPPAGRERHPVVLVSRDDAMAYARWLTERTGGTWRLPTELEWEKAIRGTDGRMFPWGARFEPDRLNSHDAGLFDTEPVGSHADGAGPFGVLDGAGQVFEWTASPDGDGRALVKGGSWDDSGCGVCRPAARHGRPTVLRHILVGFRLVRR